MQYLLELVPWPEQVDVAKAARNRSARPAVVQHQLRLVVKLSNPDALRINQLAAAARLGDRHAAERLMDMYVPVVKLLARRIMLDGVERADINAVAMTGFARALNTYDGRGGTPFDYYAKRLVSNALADLVRQRSQKRAIPAGHTCEFDADIGEAAAPGESSPLDDMRFAWQSVRECPPSDRAWLLGITTKLLGEFERVLN